jgi:hypothetical protein
VIFLILIGAGLLLLHAAQSQKKQSWYAPTDAHAAAHAKQARVYKVTGWIVIGLCRAIPVGLMILLTLFPPTFTF